MLTIMSVCVVEFEGPLLLYGVSFDMFKISLNLPILSLMDPIFMASGLTDQMCLCYSVVFSYVSVR